MLPFTSTGGRSAAAGDGDAGRKVTGADSGFRRTACIHPRPRVSARIRFAVRSLLEALDREITKFQRLCWHLIHRKTRVKSEEWRVELAPASEVRIAMFGRSGSLDLIHRKRSPFPS